MARRPLRIVKAYVVAPDAESDLQQIWRYLLGEAGLAVANHIQAELVDTFDELAEIPGKGHRRIDLTSRNVLFFGVYEYLIVYRRAAKVERLSLCSTPSAILSDYFDLASQSDIR